MSRNLFATVSKSALKHNLAQVREYAKGQSVLAMVKANAYGHGLKEVALALDSVDAFGVACLEEALRIRESGLNNPIVLMEGFFKETELPFIERQKLTCVVHADYQVEVLSRYHAKAALPIWLKVNIGMNRLGLPLSQIHNVYHKLSENKSLNVLGIMGHFAQADEPNNPLTQKQYQSFVETLTDLPGLRSLANSAGILHWPLSHEDWVRPGLMLYGASPVSGSTGSDYGLKPAMTLTSEIISIQTLKKGDKVGYGGQWVCEDSQRKIAIVAVGYGDGYPRHAANGTPVLIHHKRALLVGRVSMDMIAVDISNIPEAAIGDPVTLWGPDLPIEIIAEHAETIPYELFCRLTDRVKVTWID